MSYPEFQTEEKSVQRIPEDLEILSEYSWNMADYTSRFGFFYQGNENADIDGLTKWQAEHIFQLTPTPPGMEDELQNMEKTRRINKEKKKEIAKKNEAIGEAYLAKAVQKRTFSISAFISMPTRAESIAGCIRSFAETVWIHTTRRCFWI